MKVVLYYLISGGMVSSHFAPIGAGYQFGLWLRDMVEGGSSVGSAGFYAYETSLSDPDFSLSPETIPEVLEGVWREPTLDEWEEFLKGTDLALTGQNL